MNADNDNQYVVPWDIISPLHFMENHFTEFARAGLKLPEQMIVDIAPHIEAINKHVNAIYNVLEARDGSSID